MLFNIKHFLPGMLLLAVVQTTLSAHPSKSSNSADTSTAAPTTPHPTTIKLQQLKNMEESALKGWYDMVNRFLLIIKPDHKTLDYVIDFLNGKPDLDIQATVLEIAKMNYAFLTMIIIGIVYVCVMLITGIFFFCCRFCGRCGAKDSQRQRRNDNCWRTMHKFCLILMIAFLVVPITCMWIINQHLKESSEGVKGNATEVFNILIEFANETDKDLDDKLQAPFNPLQNFDSFKTTFVELVHDNITSSIDHEKLEEIKNIVNWVLSVEDQHSEIVNASVLSKSVKDLKSRIATIREQTAQLNDFNCSDSKKKICNLDLKKLSLEEMNVDDAYVHVQSEFQKLLKINFEELKNIIDKIQNNTVLKSKIEEQSESLKRFAEDATPNDLNGLEDMKKSIKVYTQKVREFATYSKRDLQQYINKADEYEDYRWYTMFGIAAVLFVPVALLTLGLMCGCCGYEKERHPTKRSSTSNCGGMCLILAVYYFFLVSSLLMVVTMLLFVLGGNMQTFVCIPLYEENFQILDQMKEKFNVQVNNTIFQHVTPSQLLHDCKDDKSIMVAMGLFDENDSHNYEKLLPAVADSINTEEIDMKLKKTILEITSGIREKLDQFTNALNLRDMKDIPLRLQESLKSSKANLSEFIDEVRTALDEETGGHSDTLNFVNESAAMLFEVIDDFEKKLMNFSAPLLNIYKEADNYKAKIREIEKSLDKVEDKLPKVIKAHLIQAIASSSGYTDKIKDIGRCYKVWISFDIARTAVCEFVVYPINGFWFALGWALVFIIPTIFFSVKLSRYYIRMKYDDDPYIHDSGEAIPLDDMGRTKPFSYTNPGPINWMHQFSQHQNYMVHPTSNQARQFHYK